MTLLRSLPENATLADLRRTYADLLEKLLEAHSVHGNEAMFKERGPMLKQYGYLPLIRLLPLKQTMKSNSASPTLAETGRRVERRTRV